MLLELLTLTQRNLQHMGLKACIVWVRVTAPRLLAIDDLLAKRSRIIPLSNLIYRSRFARIKDLDKLFSVVITATRLQLS